MTETYDNRIAGETRQGNWMQTYRGGRFWPLDPRPHEIHVEDVAASLSKICRYNGHCLEFYSVAEHSVYVSRVVPPEDALAGLLHDATEAYVGDVIRPLKSHLAGYAGIEHRVWLALAARFGLPERLPDSVKVADNAVLLAEMAQIMEDPPQPWNVPGTAADVEILSLLPSDAKHLFLQRYRELTQKGN